MPPSPGPHMEEALGELGLLEQRGRLFPDERATKGAVEEFLGASGTVTPGV